MTRWAARILERYGQAVTVERKGAVEAVRAFLQPLTERREAGPEPSPIGNVDGRLWLYLGRTALEAGDLVCWEGRRFRVRSRRPHYIGTELSHWRAVLERAREAE
ncbi:MAG: hypothetical protein HFF99_01840 [Oscillibacter sp.]|nr:hypothetical protein [uncultured Oscillibacter sp.]MCI8970181.1 hypothetical protein [Oscillibacter sp.]